MSFWKRLFGVVEGPPVHRPLLATLQPTLPDQDKRDDIKASASVCSEATAIFVWKADVMPTSYGRVAQDALSSAFRIALRPNLAEVLSLEARAGDVLGPNPIGESLRSFLMRANAETANVDAEIRASIRTGKAVDYIPYVLVVNAGSDRIQLAHQELLGKQVVGYLGVISINPPISLSRVERQLSLPIANLQISSGRAELSGPELIQLLAQAEKESDKAKTVALCDQILANNPDCSDGHNLRGWALKELNRIDEAESAYRRAIEIDPKHAAALWNLSYIVGSERRDYRSAVLLIDRAIALKPPFLPRAISERARYASLADEADQLRKRGGPDNTTMDTASTANPATTTTVAAEITIHDAAKSGDFERVKALLKDNPELVFSKDRDDETPLHCAAEGGHKNVADLLLSSKAEINAKNKYGNTPLHRAAWKGHKDVVEFLLANKTDVNARDNSGLTPLHAAAAEGRKDVAELLLAGRADFNAETNRGDTPLHAAASGGHREVAELLLANGADNETKNNKGESPGDWALADGRLDVAELLLQYSEYPTDTRLHDAARDGNLGIVKALLKDKPNLVFIKDQHNGATPLHKAANKDVAELLLAQGANVNARGRLGETPLHLAAGSGYTDVAEFLLASKAQVNAMDDNICYTALHWAARSGHPDLAELLLANGADVNAKGRYVGKTPLQVAEEMGQKAVAELLRQYGGHE
jgi:ankyrin repeat protein